MDDDDEQQQSEEIDFEVYDHPSSLVLNVHTDTSHTPDPLIGQPPIDYGWAWVICFASMLQRSITFGTLRGNGVIFLGVVEQFEITYEKIAWIMTLCVVGLTILSPVANILADKLTARKITFLGGILCFLAHGLSSVAPNYYFLYFSYGLLLGIGIAMVHSPGLILVVQYFSKRRSLACGIAMSGAPFGGAVIPQLISYLLEEYGLRGTFLIMAGIQLQICLLATLCRPFTFYTGEHPACSTDYTPTTLQSIENSNINVLSKAIIKARFLVRKSLKWSLWKSPFYVCMGLVIGLSSIGMPLSFLILPMYAKEIGLTHQHGAQLALCMGIPDLISRLVTGQVADHLKTRTKRTSAYCVAITAHAGVWFFMKVCGDYGFPGLITLSCFLGLTGGALNTLYPVLLVDWFGLEHLNSALGFTMVIEGFVLLLTPEFTGRIKDETGTWIYAGYGIGGLIAISAIIVLVIIAMRSILNKRRGTKIDKQWQITRKIRQSQKSLGSITPY